MRCRIGSECEMVLLRRIPQDIKNNTWLHASNIFRLVDLDDIMHILGHIYNHCNITALPCQACAPATCEERRTKEATCCHSLDYIFYTPWDDDTDWHLSIIRAVCRVERPAPIIKAHFASNPGLQFFRQCFGIDVYTSHPILLCKRTFHWLRLSFTRSECVFSSDAGHQQRWQDFRPRVSSCLYCSGAKGSLSTVDVGRSLVGLQFQRQSMRGEQQ